MRSLIFLILLSPLVFADEIELNIFSNGEVADADEVNENFNNLKNSIESIEAYKQRTNSSRIAMGTDNWGCLMKKF